MSISGIDEFNQVTSTNARLFQVTEVRSLDRVNSKVFTRIRVYSGTSQFEGLGVSFRELMNCDCLIPHSGHTFHQI